MANNSTNINKTDNHLAPQTIEHTTYHEILCWKSRSCLGSCTKCGGFKPQFSFLLLDLQLKM